GAWYSRIADRQNGLLNWEIGNHNTRQPIGLMSCTVRVAARTESRIPRGRMNNNPSSVPEGHAIIAQRFNVGMRAPKRVSPEGTADSARDFNRPFGTCDCSTSSTQR